MKVHIQTPANVSDAYMEAATEAWRGEGLLPNFARKCDGLMVPLSSAKSLTDDESSVTCKRCLKYISN